MTKDEWLEKLRTDKSFSMDNWDSETSFEIFVTKDMEKELCDLENWDKQYYDEEHDCPSWTYHLYAFNESGKVRYEAVFYPDWRYSYNLNENYITMSSGLKAALDTLVIEKCA